MIDTAEARRIARANIGPAEEVGEILIEEYEDGFVARAKPDDEVGENGLPRRVGQGCIVIDKVDGTVSGAAYIGPQTIEQWRTMKAQGLI